MDSNLVYPIIIAALSSSFITGIGVKLLEIWQDKRKARLQNKSKYFERKIIVLDEHAKTLSYLLNTIIQIELMFKTIKYSAMPAHEKFASAVIEKMNALIDIDKNYKTAAYIYIDDFFLGEHLMGGVQDVFKKVNELQNLFDEEKSENEVMTKLNEISEYYKMFREHLKSNLDYLRKEMKKYEA